jgi:uncharacterized repeat protein (TIGR03803 family)
MKKATVLPLVLQLLVGLVNIPASNAQSFRVLHEFTPFSKTSNSPPYYTNSDGARPLDALILMGNTLYGTTAYGGSSNSGTVFAVNTDGTGFTNLHVFAGYPREGANPQAGLALSGGTLYGTTLNGGSEGYGTVFAVHTDGTGFTNLHNFSADFPYPYTNQDGANPWGGLLFAGSRLYGTAEFGGTNTRGTVFALNTDGTGFTNLHNFAGSPDEGAVPQGGLVLSGTTLYGTTADGGSSNDGTVFAINCDGTDFTNLHSFVGNDGHYPLDSLVLSGNTLYGTTQDGGTNVDNHGEGFGTIFAIQTDGTGFTNLYYFTPTVSDPYTNGDGANPSSTLILSCNTLYGTALYGGPSGKGTVFAVNTNGGSFATLYSFTGASDGGNPEAGLIRSGNTLYGTMASSGTNGGGLVFGLSFAPQLAIVPKGTNVILSWPANAAGFDYSRYKLQSATNLTSGEDWSAISLVPTSIGGQKIVTNPISGAQMFFRLSQPEVPSDMALIPEGSFTIGDTLDGINDATPTNVTVSAFHMDINLVCYAQWLSVYNWATNHGYEFDNSGSGKAANQPVQTVDWSDAVKWCNARSRMAGLPPVYFTDINLTEEYTNGLVNPYVNWMNNGYRLPTEAEWEKAARGGLSAQRFPWGDTISEAQANYTSGDVASPPPAYDLGPSGPNSIGINGGTPYTSPVGSFGTNGYGLYDMTGNVYEYCWDWYAPPPYPNGSPYLGGIDPLGPVTGAGSPFRVLRGGCWDFTAMFARCAARFYMNPHAAGDIVGFRCVRGH